MGPILLEMGMDPRISTGTSNFMGLFTSFSTSVQYTMLGKLIWSLAWKFMICSGVASLTGNTILKRIVAHYGKRSIIVILLAIVLGISTISLPAVTLLRLMSQYKKGIDIYSLRNFCANEN
mmetsp:Transcript_83080/g.179327  ORF Transcript_83080/g.179327 Transcript_83080/m.179327 type:complete len:121 (-) Transcript_83080:147-509(-)